MYSFLLSYKKRSRLNKYIICISLILQIQPLHASDLCAKSVQVQQKNWTKHCNRKYGTFSIIDQLDPYNYYLSADLHRGSLFFEIYTQTIHRRSHTLPRGHILFKKMINFYGPENIDIIEGNWILAEPGRRSDNIAAVNKYISLNPTHSLHQAIWQAWTAKQAKKFGFSHIRIVKQRLQNKSSNQYRALHIEFSKHESIPGY